MKQNYSALKKALEETDQKWDLISTKLKDILDLADKPCGLCVYVDNVLKQDDCEFSCTMYKPCCEGSQSFRNKMYDINYTVAGFLNEIKKAKVDAEKRLTIGYCASCYFNTAESAEEVRCASRNKAEEQEKLVDFEENGGTIWVTPIEDIDAKSKCSCWQSMADPRKFKCRVCGRKYIEEFCATIDVSICRWCSGEEK